MKITYDQEVDALSITFSTATVTTREIGDGIAADYDAAGRLAGIEVLDAKARVGIAKELEEVVLQGLSARAQEG